MFTVEVKVALPVDVYRSAEQSAFSAGLSVEDYLASLVRSQVRTEQDELAIEGYQALADETLEFAASAVATVRETWPRWEETSSSPVRRRASLRPATKNTCRAEVLDAARTVVGRSGADQFSMHDVLDELHRRGSKYSVNTIRTYIASVMCANANRNHATVYNDLERVDHGLYRLTSSALGQRGANGD